MMDTITYIESLFLFYLKGEIKQEENFIKLKDPNTILGVIPLGAKKDNIPINQIASVDTNFKMVFKTFFGGVILGSIGMLCFTSSVLLALILIALGAMNCINSFQTILSIKTTSGAVKELQFIVFEKAKAEQACEQILKLISNRLDDTNVRKANDALGDRLVDAIQNKQ